MLRRQDLSVVLFHFLRYGTLRNSLLRVRHRAVARFVTFHDVPVESFRLFREKLDFLKRRTRVISLEDYFAVRLSEEKINVVITFDDGYGSDIAVPAPEWACRP
jgi:hypothetical protein